MDTMLTGFTATGAGACDYCGARDAQRYTDGAVTVCRACHRDMARYLERMGRDGATLTAY